jgi:succinate dehydrogenase / fumarate reductase cytochrome b subunit
LIPGLNNKAIADHISEGYSIVSNEFHNGWIMALYIVGVLATAWHLAYGIWLFAVDWGIVIGEKAQKITLYACLGLAVFLSAVGINAAAAFVRKCGLLPQAMCEESIRTSDAIAPKRF